MYTFGIRKSWLLDIPWYFLYPLSAFFIFHTLIISYQLLSVTELHFQLRKVLTFSPSVNSGNREPCRPWNHAAVLPQREAYPSHTLQILLHMCFCLIDCIWRASPAGFSTRLVNSLTASSVRLTGTKYGCGGGGCGACTVMVSRYQPATKTIMYPARQNPMTPAAPLWLAGTQSHEYFWQCGHFINNY